MPYTQEMRSRKRTARPPAEPPKASMWNRLSEGRRADELWSQFTADARSSYGFYGKDVNWEEITKLPKWHRPLHIAKGMFLAMLNKLSPARRILLVIAFVLLLSSGFKFDFADGSHLEV